MIERKEREREREQGVIKAVEDWKGYVTSGMFFISWVVLWSRYRSDSVVGWPLGQCLITYSMEQSPA